MSQQTKSNADESVSFWAQVKFYSVAGVGFFADGYLNKSIGLVVPMLGYVYFQDNKGSVPTRNADVIKGSLSLGMIVGQITFGILGDTIGRRRVYGRELMMTIFGTLMCVLLPWRGLSQNGIVAWMAVWRVVTGFGIGGDYPMSSSLAAERNRLGSRGRVVMTVTFFTAIGTAVAFLMLVILLAAFKTRIEEDVSNMDYVWRLLMGLGLIPCFLTVYARMTMKETKPYEKYVLKQTEEEIAMNTPPREKRTWRDQRREFKAFFSKRRHLQALTAVCLGWLLSNISSYGVGLNQSVILKSIGFASGKTPYETMWNTAIGSLIIEAAGYLPGHFIGIWLPDLMGRKPQQFYLSALAVILYIIWAALQGSASTGGLITLLTLSQLFQGAGPGVTTFLIPAELFPTRVRASAHGIAAACGQIGSIITAFSFGTVTTNIGIGGMFGLLAGFLNVVALCTFLWPEPKGASLDDLENDVLYTKPVPLSQVLWTKRRVVENRGEAGQLSASVSDVDGVVKLTVPRKDEDTLMT